MKYQDDLALMAAILSLIKMGCLIASSQRDPRAFLSFLSRLLLLFIINFYTVKKIKALRATKFKNEKIVH